MVISEGVLAAKVVRVRLIRGPEQILDKFRELRVRSWVVRQLAHIYIERHIVDLGNRPGVLKIHAGMRESTVEASLKAHVERRITEFYPSVEYGQDGAVFPEFKTMVQQQRQGGAPKGGESVFDMKQTAMPERPENESLLFENVRPSIVTDEASSANTLHDDVVAEHALKSISALTIKMSNKFENQFVSKYTPRIFPWH